MEWEAPSRKIYKQTAEQFKKNNRNAYKRKVDTKLSNISKATYVVVTNSYHKVRVRVRVRASPVSAPVSAITDTGNFSVSDLS
jgi:predicted solute-binding protein